MNLELKNTFLTIFNKLFNERKFDSLFLLLQNGNYYLEIVLESDIWNERTQENYLIPLCYLYNFKLFESRSDLFKSIEKGILPINKLQMAKDFSTISIKLGNDYMVGMFKEIEKHLLDFDERMEIDHPEIKIEGGIAFLIRGIKMMSFNGIDWDKGIDYGFTEEEFLSKIHIQTEVNNITEQPFFHKFNESTRLFLKSGTQLLQIVFDSSNNDLLDYSPMLYNFIKAVESETKEIFQLYRDKILSYTPGVIYNIEKLEYKKHKDLYKLSSECKRINEYNFNYEPSGLKPLYFLLKYFFLRERSNLTGIDKDIISKNVKEILFKNKVIVEEIYHKGETRNDLVHSRIIDSKIEFFWHYNDIYTILEILTSIKV